MAENQTEAPERQFAVQRIYVKDLSFESPNSPGLFRGEWKPRHDLTLNTRVNQLDEQTFEVVLAVTVTAKVEESTAFIAEVQQAGIFTINGFPDQEKGPLLGAYCPNVLFPYAREVITDLVAKGSFPQLVLQPVNFDALFAQHQQEAAQQARAASAPPSAH